MSHAGKLTKAQLIASFNELPEDATVEDFIDHLAFILGVEEGLADIHAGRTISTEELLKRIDVQSRGGAIRDG